MEEMNGDVREAISIVKEIIPQMKRDIDTLREEQKVSRRV